MRIFLFLHRSFESIIDRPSESSIRKSLGDDDIERETIEFMEGSVEISSRFLERSCRGEDDISHDARMIDPTLIGENTDFFLRETLDETHDII